MGRNKKNYGIIDHRRDTEWNETYTEVSRCIIRQIICQYSCASKIKRGHWIVNDSEIELHFRINEKQLFLTHLIVQ